MPALHLLTFTTLPHTPAKPVHYRYFPSGQSPCNNRPLTTTTTILLLSVKRKGLLGSEQKGKRNVFLRTISRRKGSLLDFLPNLTHLGTASLQRVYYRLPAPGLHALPDHPDPIVLQALSASCPPVTLLVQMDRL